MVRWYARIDLLDPEGEILTPTDNSLFAEDSIRMTWNGSDEHSGVDEYHYRVDNGDWISAGLDTEADVTGLGDGDHFLYLRISDAVGNISVDSVLVTVDTTPPVILSQHPDQLLNTDENCEAVIPDYTTDVSGEDAISGTLSVTQHPLAGTVIQEMESLVTLTVTDEAGNFSEAIFSLTLMDVTDPVFAAAPADITVACEGDVPAMTNLAWTDNCDGSGSVSGSDASDGGSNPETITRTWSYTDAAGNSATATQTIVVDDQIAPVADEATLADVTAECEVTGLTAPTATDNCDGAISGEHDATLPITTQGTTIVTWTYTDAAGNITIQEQKVIVIDDTPPMVECVGNVEVTPDEGNADYTVKGTEFDPVTATDNCELTDLSNSLTGSSSLDGEVLSEGTYKIIWTATDGAMNQDSCSFNLTVLPSVGTSTASIESFRLYPNPSREYIIIERPEEGTARILVTDAGGRILKDMIITGHRFRLNVGSLQQGVYFLKVSSAEDARLLKLIIQ